jgi:hypothetical protein
MEKAAKLIIQINISMDLKSNFPILTMNSFFFARILLWIADAERQHINTWAHK